MTQQIINTGTGPDSYTGDTLRTAFTKVNDNFSQLYAGNVGGNITVANVTASGNVTADYFFGDGSNLTGIVATSSYGDANVAAFLPYNSANVAGGYFIGNGALLTGIASSSSYGNTNVAAYLPTYSGNVNAAYFTGNGALLTGISATANLGNLLVTGSTGQTLAGTVPGSLFISPYAGNSAVIQTEFDSTGIKTNLVISSIGNAGVAVSTGVNSLGATPNLVMASGSASIRMIANTGSIGFNGTPGGYTYSFYNGSLYSREFYAEAGFPTGYQFNTPGGDTGLSHTYQDDINGNVSLLRLRHDSSVPAKFYENNTSELSGNLVVVQAGSAAGSFPDAFVQTYSTANTYTQFIWQNLDSNGAATGDIVITSDTGTDTSDYIDMGMTGSGYDNTNPNNSLGTSVGGNDGYLYVKGANDAMSGNLTIGTVDAGTVTRIIAGGVDAANVVAIFSETGLMPGGNVLYDLGSSTAQWRDLWLSNSTMYLGGYPVTVSNTGALSVNGAVVSGNYTNTNVAGFLAAFGSNSITTTGNINANINASYVRANGLYGTTTDDTAFLSNASGLIRVLVQDNGINIQTYDHPNLNYHTWSFNSVGDLYLPSNNGGIYRANGQPYSGESYGNSNVAAYLPAYTGNIGASNIAFTNDYVYTGNTFISPETNGILKNFQWKFSDTATGADTVTLQWNLLDTTFPQWYLTTNSQGNVYVFDGDAKSMGFIDSGISSGTVTFGTAANNGTGGSNDIELTTVTGNAYVRTGSNSWAFDNAGALNLPGNTAFLYSTADAVYLNSDSTTFNSIDIVTNGDTILRNQRAVKIVADSDGSGHNWVFNANGNLTLPTNSSTITYANGTSILSGFTAPTQIVNGNTSVYIPTEGGDITFQRLGTNYGHIGTGLAIGYIAGNLNQGTSAVALGTGAGTENQGTHSVAIGWNVGQYDQGAGAIAIGENPGFATQGDYAIAIGTVAGRSSQGSYAIAMGVGSGYSGQTANAVAIGTRAGQYTQGQNAIAIGLLAGNSSQGGSSIAVGPSAGADTQGSNSVAVGGGAGYLAQGNGATALGAAAGEYNQGNFAVALGGGAAYSGQGIGAIAIGADASPVQQGAYSIAIGASVSGSGIQPNNSIIIDAMASSLAATGPGLFVNPVRSADGANVSLSYNTSTKEITYSANTFVSNTYVPSTAGSAGTIGQISFDSDYVYICVGTDTWKRANLSTW